MRRLNPAGRTGTRDERGVIAPLTAILMVAMLGMTAFAVDTAMMYSEHAQLQNGADSSALAIAKSCSAGLGTPDCQKDLAGASALAGGNALDGVTEVVKAKVDDTAGIVDVEVQASDTAGKKYFSLVFAQALGIDTVDIRANAQATFSGYSKAHVLPLTFSKCESDPDFTKGLQFYPVHGSSGSVRATDPSRVCKTKTSSGAEIPGGFGWLVHDVLNGKCSLPIGIKTDYKSDQGNNVPADCNIKFDEFEAALKAGKSFDVLVPIYDHHFLVGKDPWFSIEAFAQISLRGWQFSGGGGRTYLTPEAQALHTNLGLKTSDSGLFGQFVKKVSWAEAAALGGPRIYGTGGVRLTN